MESYVNENFRVAMFVYMFHGVFFSVLKTCHFGEYREMENVDKPLTMIGNLRHSVEEVLYTNKCFYTY